MAKHKKKSEQHGKNLIPAPDEVQYLFEQFGRESDRACVILAAAVMEEYLSKILKSTLVQIPGNEDLLFDGTNAPIGTFGAKITVAYRLGLISKKLHDSLTIVRKIRNEFAHDIFHCNFENQSIRDRLSNLREVIGSMAETAYKGYSRTAGINPLFEAAMAGSEEKQRFFVCATLIIIALDITGTKAQPIDEASAEPMFKPGRPVIQTSRHKRRTK